MGKRKPPVPRRRIGVHFADVTVQRSVRFSAPLTSACLTASANDAGSAEVPASQSSSNGATPAPSAEPLTGHDRDERFAPPPRLHYTGKSAVTTVPLKENNAASGHPAKPLDETVTMSVAELEAWKQRTVMQIEDHFTNEQLKRIAEFGRAHANLVKEAKEYVASIELQLKEQFERDRESLKSQAEVYVGQFQEENQELRLQVQALEEELKRLHSEVGEKESDEKTSPFAAKSASRKRSDLGIASLEEEKSGDEMVLSGAQLDAATEVVTNGKPRAIGVFQAAHVDQEKIDEVSETMSRRMELQTPPATKTGVGRPPRQIARVLSSPTDGASTTTETHQLPLQVGPIYELIILCPRSERVSANTRCI